MTTYIDNLLWRYATKKFDATKKLTAEQLDELLEALRLSATSYGLQPYKFLVITDPVLRAQLREHAWGQSQITDASHLIVLCARKTLDVAYVDHFIDVISKERNVPVQTLKGYRDIMANSIQHQTPADLEAWDKKQTYIALGFLLSAAAQLHIDSCPMEGFDAAKFDAVLGLQEEQLTAAVLCPVGFRAADDEYASSKKVRFARDELFDFRD